MRVGIVTARVILWMQVSAFAVALFVPTIMERFPWLAGIGQLRSSPFVATLGCVVLVAALWVSLPYVYAARVMERTRLALIAIGFPVLFSLHFASGAALVFAGLSLGTGSSRVNRRPAPFGVWLLLVGLLVLVAVGWLAVFLTARGGGPN
jgi:hypothetical protein